MSVGAELLIILALILANAVFAGAEIAILSVRKTRARELADEGRPAAQAILRLRDQPETFLATVQIGITVVGATAAAFGGATVARVLTAALERLGAGRASEDLALAIVIGGISFASLVLGELVPKSLALRSAERYALFISRPLLALAWLARPLVWFLTLSSNLILRFFKDQTTFTEARFSKEELQQLVDEAATAGALDPRAGEIAYRALEFGDIRVLAVMVPRADMITLDVAATHDQVRALLASRGHSRIPVRRGTDDDIIGYVTSRDLFALVTDGGTRTVHDVLRDALFVPETRLATDVLKDMQKARDHLAIVVDEQGLVTGLVTLEDLVEELVGEIFAEHDTAPERIRRESDDHVLVRGLVAVHELNRELGVELPEDPRWVTVGGLATALAGTIPPPGTRLEAGPITLEVVESTERRVVSVRLHLARETTTEDKERA